jgi:hypothetical protein
MKKYKYIYNWKFEKNVNLVYSRRQGMLYINVMTNDDVLKELIDESLIPNLLAVFRVKQFNPAY